MKEHVSICSVSQIMTHDHMGKNLVQKGCTVLGQRLCIFVFMHVCEHVFVYIAGTAIYMQRLSKWHEKSNQILGSRSEVQFSYLLKHYPIFDNKC